ncbi:hypothetical protein IQ260_25775 [Leptolyngbya cf. ectocarpi LEGE 11479]|uniref:Uncharacterized protein n=1 Tax=Leptolyngbya cf. ectocarpi LEGE 11479 TaxID=1828722 RepID=A0A929F9V9_LEPEC|nr:hypothetical protein [Leptolyngbya cf. ectocarpi LEGE 11479]
MIGISLLLYGAYLATLTGSYTTIIFPEIGSIGSGAVAGVGVGFFTSLLVGTVGVATGGIGIAIGALGMSAIGGFLGMVGAASGGFGIKTLSYPLVSPWFWAPILAIALWLIIHLPSQEEDVEPEQ